MINFSASDERRLRVNELCSYLGIKRSTIYARMNECDSQRHDPNFPKRYKDGRNAYWLLSEVINYIRLSAK